MENVKTYDKEFVKLLKTIRQWKKVHIQGALIVEMGEALVRKGIACISQNVGQVMGTQQIQNLIIWLCCENKTTME